MYLYFRETKFYRREQKLVLLHLPNVIRMIRLLSSRSPPPPLWTSKLRAAIPLLTRKTWSEISGVCGGLCGLNYTRNV
jgi:hypothetical protein